MGCGIREDIFVTNETYKRKDDIFNVFGRSRIQRVSPMLCFKKSVASKNNPSSNISLINDSKQIS